MRPVVIVGAFLGLVLLRGFDRCAGSSQLKPSSAAVRVEGADSTPVLAEREAYEIYSLLLRTEVPWQVETWTIQQWTERSPLPMCIEPAAEQEAIYRPVIEDFQRKNERRFVLQRQFDLPFYALVRPADTLPMHDREVLFEVSAVGFNPEHSRALVYVAHHCGRKCGGGMYHLLVKEKEHWTMDRGFRGAPPCLWKS